MAARFSATWVFLAALCGCTVAIPDADKFPEARDIAAGVDAVDAGKTDVAADIPPDTHDAGPDAAEIDVAETAETDAAQTDAASEVDDADAIEVDAPGDVSVDVDDAGTELPDSATEADAEDAVDAVDSVDAGPSCTPSQCDDANPCTTDGCDLADACTHSDLSGTACPDDGLPCTGDVCQAGSCNHGDLLENWCIIGGTCVGSGGTTADSCGVCDPASSPTAWTPKTGGTGCSDGSACTVGDSCQAGVCIPGDITTCSDGNPCTADLCDKISGCSNPNLDDGSGCPALGFCKLPGYCASGVCQSPAKLWQISMDSGLGTDEVFKSVAATGAGHIVVAGQRLNGLLAEGWALRLNAAGDLLETLPMLSGAGDAGYVAAAVSAEGVVGLLGNATQTDASVQVTLTLIGAGGVTKVIPLFATPGAATALLNVQDGWYAARTSMVARADGAAQVWEVALKENNLQIHSLAAMPDNGVLAVAQGAGPQAVVARVSATGVLLWERAYGDGAMNVLYSAHVANGLIHLIGNRDGKTWFVDLDSDGRLVSERVWPFANIYSGKGAVFASDNSWRVTGSSGGITYVAAFDVFANVLRQKPVSDISIAAIGLLPDGGIALVGATASTPTDGAVYRLDPWGEGDCAVSKLCSNLTLSACDDGLGCTADACGLGGSCTHTSLDGGGCDDGSACSVLDTCGGTSCNVSSAGLFDRTDGNVTAWDHVVGRTDGGIVVSGTAGFLSRRGASGGEIWSQFVSGGSISGLASLANGSTFVLLSSGTISQFTSSGALLPSPINVDAITAGTCAAIAALSDDRIVVACTTDSGAADQTAVLERFSSGAPISLNLPGSFGTSASLAIARASDDGVGVLTTDGAFVRLHRISPDFNENWSQLLSYPTLTSLSAMPDGGWIAVGMTSKGLAVERRDAFGGFEFAEQWPIAGLTSVTGVVSLPDGTIAISVNRSISGIPSGGIVRMNALGGVLSIHWGGIGTVASGIVRSERPDGLWTIGQNPGGGWSYRTDVFGGSDCAVSGSCISQSLVCDDGNPCTSDGCSGGLCVSVAPGDDLQCLNGGVCTSDHACPLLGQCGDGKCNINETSSDCPGDCASSCDSMNCNDGDPCTTDYCKDGTCAIGGAPDGTACGIGKVCAFSQCVPPTCGNGTCDSGESASSCPGDCPACGNGTCQKGENNHICPADCQKPVSGCKDMCGWKSQKPGGGVCWCDDNCTPGPGGDCCSDKASFCP